MSGRDTDRHQCVLDLETTGLDRALHVPVEIAYWDLTTGERGCFVPSHSPDDILAAEPVALEINGYWNRGLDNPNRWDDGTKLRELHAVLAGSELVGANPAFDTALLSRQFREHDLDPEPWHHRMWDVEVLAAGKLTLPKVPGLREVCQLLDLTPGDHTATGDVTATGRAFMALQSMPGRVILDPASAEDAERLARIALRIPAGTRLQKRERVAGRTMLRQLAEGAA
ncbi:MAG TPA: exonuclease domain-containing protein [Nocardioides sp.]